VSVEVHIEWAGQTHLAGRLHAAERGPSLAFEYARTWLARDGAFAIDPTSLPLRSGTQHAPALFGAVADCGPDRWGRVLIQRAVRKKFLQSKPYRDLDYVLALDDATRLGALRFRSDESGPFLAAARGQVPPLVRLSALLRATEAMHAETETGDDLRFLLGAGSPLGGARPKCAVSLADGRLALAKFPKPDDTRDIAAGEILALELAQRCGIRVAEHRLVSIAGKHAAVITRFDRAGQRRIPFLSGASLLGMSLAQGAPASGAGAREAAGEGSYTMLADGIRQHGDDVAGDLRELWRRLVFSLLVSNVDDHLRNHGFLMLAAGRWSLSPAYDLNPVPELERAHSRTPITEDGEEPSMASALAAAPRFGLTAVAAKQIMREVFTAVTAWRDVGRARRLRASTLNAYASAFEHPLADEARRLVQG